MITGLDSVYIYFSDKPKARHNIGLDESVTVKNFEEQADGRLCFSYEYETFDNEIEERTEYLTAGKVLELKEGILPKP